MVFLSYYTVARAIYQILALYDVIQCQYLVYGAHRHVITNTYSALEQVSQQCSRASQPTFKHPHGELLELQNSVLCTSLAVIREKEVI